MKPYSTLTLKNLIRKSTAILFVLSIINVQAHAGEFKSAVAKRQIAAVDVAITKTTSAIRQMKFGEVITFTVKVFRQDKQFSSVNIEVRDSISSNFQLVSATPSQGTFQNGLWTGISITNSDTATLELALRVNTMEGGYQQIPAWVSYMSAPDVDSSPYDDSVTEDDYANTSIMLAASICTSKKTTKELTAPEGYTTYQWQKNGVNIEGATSNTYTVDAIGTYQVLIDNRYNIDTGCCSMVVEDYCETQVAYNIPFSVKKVSKL
jgi:uncharacterized repeat protein (TIGR01451 family)